MQIQKGVSFIELILVVVIIASTVLLLASLPNAFLLINKSRHLSLAKEIASKQIEDKRGISFSNLVNDSLPISDPRINLLPSGSGTIIVSDCDVSICIYSENIKKVTATVSWKDNNKTQSISLDTFIGVGGINQ